jgi:hypothetical protein
MITIGITFCDNDYQNCDKLTLQIKERVHVPYELIIIDNTEGNKLGNKATFAFGYNAFQFAARYKIIKLAKGEYIWFVDGDDEVIGLEAIRYDDDILSYNVRSETINDNYEDTSFMPNAFNRWDFLHSVIHGALWNKLFRRSLFNDIDNYVTDPLLKVVSLEDTFYVALALKNSRSLHICNEVIYKHYRGTSSALSLTLEQFKTLTTGFNDVLKLFVKLGYDEQEILGTHLRYFASCVLVCDNPTKAMIELINLYPSQEYWFSFYEQLVHSTQNEETFALIETAYKEVFGQAPMAWFDLTHEDGHTERFYYEIKPNRIQ